MEAVRAVARPLPPLRNKTSSEFCVVSLSSRGLVVAWARRHVVARALIAWAGCRVVTWARRRVGGINGLYVFFLLCYHATLTAAATKTKPIGNDDDRRFTIIVNSASTEAPIGLPPKMAEFCHTCSNRSLLVRQCRRALLRLYFNSSATGRRSVVGGRWSVGGRSEIKAAGL